MPWEKSFDIDEAVDKATEVFWAKGYEATSLSDLTQAMGVNKGSFYNAFGSKKALFMKALIKYYQDQHIATLNKLRKLDEPVSAIRKLFDILIEQSRADEQFKGCLLVNTALDLPNHEADVDEAVKRGFHDLNAFFVEQIELGIKRGEIAADKDVKSASEGLIALVAGLRVLARGIYTNEELRGIRTQALKIIQ